MSSLQQFSDIVHRPATTVAVNNVLNVMSCDTSKSTKIFLSLMEVQLVKNDYARRKLAHGIEQW